MSDSDDFGISDDDTAFVAVATQVEEQHGGFEPSKRPTKRQRAAYKQHSQEAALDDSQLLQSSPPPGAVTQDGYDEESYYFAGELGIDAEEEKRAKLAKYKIITSRAVGHLPSIFLSQTQVELDEDPAAIRGPIWKKPPAIPPPPLFNARPEVLQSNDANQRLQQHNSVRSFGASNLNSFVQKVQRPAHTLKTVSSDKENSDLLIDLADLPDDAFSSSFADDSVDTARPRQVQALRGPQSGLKQMTIFGQPATQPLTSSQAAKKRHAWPKAVRDEAPTHHKLDSKALETWTYPTNLGTIRDYQYSIVSRSLYHNTLVALPTGLGKTFIAATVMLNYYRWMPDAQIIFMAPTKPLIAQQMEACFGIVGIPRRDTILMTGETTPAIRAEEWLERKVFFMTPQTVINDLKTGICDPKKIVLIVVDEAHKATGGYAYTEVVAFLRRFNPSFRVLALTATPGSTVEAVQAVIDNLGISRVELRTEASIDIRQYTHEKQTDTQVFSYSEEQELIMGHISKAIQPVLDKLSGQNAYWSRDPMALTPFGLQTARGKYMQSDAGRKAPMGVKGMVNSIFTTLASLAHGLNLLKYHGIGPFYTSLREFQRSLEEEQTKRKYARQIVESEGFSKAMGFMRAWSNNVDFIGHPKMEYLREVIMNHFLDAGEGQQHKSVRPTRVMIFSSFRDSTEEICRVLKRNEPLVRPHVFVGQSASKTSDGMDQKKQNAVIQDFKNGKYNTLVATSIGEEGLDIGDVDLIICYDASSSPIRMLQRIGRTGRKRVGRVVLLLMRGKEENDYMKAQDSYAYIQKTIADESKYAYRDDQSPRIIPREAQPVVDKRVVDIPVENSQPIDLNERARRKRGKGKAKRPAKKFHMPDGVKTGFVKASALGSDASDDGGESSRPKARPSAVKCVKAPPASLPEAASIPFLDDILLTSEQLTDHEHRYMRTTLDDEDAVIQAPDPYAHPETMRGAMRTKFVKSGRYAKLVTSTMSAVHNMNQGIMDRWQAVRQPLTTELQFAVRARLADVSAGCRAENDNLVPRSTKPATKRSTEPAAKAGKANAPARSKPPPKAKAPARRKSAGRKSTSYGSDAMEGSESEPEPTPADMRIGTQGIDLGSNDTSGEDEDEEPDSELDAFIVNSDAPIEMLSSSLPVSQDVYHRRRRLQTRKPAIMTDTEEGDSSNEETISDDGNEITKNAGYNQRPSKRVIESDSDE
ncbi:hypothetical protein AMS68_001736 [Peltaster fructicola]|uniref:ATP-dependent DNA helicase n=1 Tax=Peltaster fructicola TaxID=286661 RepID=A0A6H0XNL5_9PEZI|nr:hypothetical protein AMS68_001736 [Peltaster fructicola]